MRHHAIRAALFGVLLLATGCAIPIGFQNPQQRAVALAQFRAGDATLDCLTLQCATVWNATRPVAQQAAAIGDWEDLAADVLAADYDQDLGWYYLGAAASGLGFRAAARTYFERSIQSSLAGAPTTCSPFACDGWNLPADARVAMASLPVAAPPRLARRRPAPRPAAPAPASPNWISPTTTGAPATGAAGGGPGWIAPVPNKSE